MSAAAVGEIPEDLWFDILLKAPAEGVVKHRRLSKFHRDLIDSPEFIRKHKDRSIKTASSHVIVTSLDGDSCRFYHRLDTSGSEITIGHRLIPPVNNDEAELVNSCMGILCFELDSRIVLWNPLTGCSREIPMKPTNPDLVYTYVLGYDSVNDDLKILKLLVSSGPKRTFDCEMYSSKMDSWVQVSMKDSVKGSESETLFIHLNPCFVEGTSSIHWLHNDGFILVYNLSTQKFNKLSLPIYNSSSIISSMDGCLCVYKQDCESYTMDLWMMKEYGDHKSWTHMFSIGYPSCNIYLVVPRRPLCFLNNRSQLIMKHRHNENSLFLYHVETAKLQKKLDFYTRNLLDSDGFTNRWEFVFNPTLHKP